MPTLKVLDWGLIDYQTALDEQLKLVDEVAENPAQGFLIFCTHPPVVTLGRKTQAGDVFDWQGPMLEISRGGRATYHGPSQLVIYPIFPVKDIHKYLRAFEQAIVDTLKSYNVEAVGKSLQTNELAQNANPSPSAEAKTSLASMAKPSNSAEETGVWVGSRKIASLGIGIKKWITYHGAAINLDEDPKAFWGMNPCGFKRETMVSLEKLTGQRIDRADFTKKLTQNLLQSLSHLS